MGPGALSLHLPGMSFGLLLLFAFRDLQWLAEILFYALSIMLRSFQIIAFSKT